MRIVESAKTVEKLKKQYAKANKGCEKCPCCKSSNVSSSYPKLAWAFGLIHTKFYYRVPYECKDCGCKYESGLFRMRKE